MPNVKTQLLASTELLDIYGTPILNDAERCEYFTLNKDEINVLTSFKDTADSVYFATSLAFFKIKRTLIDFGYQDTTEERRHIMDRYFPKNKPLPKYLPKNRNTILRIENKVLKLCGYQRFTESVFNNIKLELQQLAPNNPRQRQLCKAFLDLLAKHHIAIPGHSTIQSVVSNTWNDRSKQVIAAYVRHTTKNQRGVIFSLLNKTDRHHRIISIKKDMKDFGTNELREEIEKYNTLKPIFEIARMALPKIKLPAATTDYYASLINFYNGARLKDINKHTAQLYLLCYSYTRYQILNDNLLEVLKKRTIEYATTATEYAEKELSNQLELTKDSRGKVSGMLIAIKNHPNKKQVPRTEIYKHVPEDELITTAELLHNEKLDKYWQFWKHIDSEKDSIKLNLRNIFLTIDLVVTNDDALQSVISYVKEGLIDGSFYDKPIPDYVESWIRKNYYSYIISYNKIIHNRLEFLLYKRIAQRISTNKLTLECSIKYKRIEDDLMPKVKWNKEKKNILNELDYPKLKQPLQETLKAKQIELNELYKTVNSDILSGKNQGIILTHKENGETKWRLRPLKAEPKYNDGLLSNFQQRNIVDVIRFVDNKTKFTKAFESVLPKSKKGEQDNVLTMAAALANALRLGARKMGDISDLNKSSLLTAEANYIRVDTLIPAIDNINNATAQLPIYKKWHIGSALHGSLDGLKLETYLRNIFARPSSKYFGTGAGVSAYNEIFNFLPITGKLIGTHDYEGNFSFETVHHQNTSELKPKKISTDKHGTNVLNFGLFDLTDMIFAPRIPKPHREKFWGFGNAKDYEGLIIQPTKFVNEQLIIGEEDNIQHIVASLLIGDTKPSNIIRKLSSKDYHSKTKGALVHYNNMVKSQFLLSYLHDPELRRAISIALNRGEAYNGLYRAITLLKKGNLRGQNEIEMEIWHQCTRLISAIILYYNTYILNSLYVAATSEEEKEFLLKLSPCAWAHINLLGFYQFCDLLNDELLDQIIKHWDWKKAADAL